MNDNTRGSRRRARGWPHWAAILAALTGTALLTAACGASASGNTSANADPTATGRPTQFQQDLAFAQCMRSHGVTDFPDPNPGGGFGGATYSVRNNPHFTTATSACRHLLPNGGAGGSNKVQHNLSSLLHIAQCMRSHGIANYPDPNPNGAAADLQQLGINVNSPQFQTAQRTCQQLYPPASVPPTQGSGS
jgi:hypothetical protein